MFADPKKFCEREICQRGIAGELNEAVEADGALEFFRLRFRSLVAPDQRGTNDFVVFIEEDGAVHLAGKTNGGEGIGGEAGGLQRFANSDGSGAPPVARILLRPAGLRAGKIGMFLGARGENGAVAVQNDRASAACADVNAENWNGASYWADGKRFPLTFTVDI